MLFGDVAPRPTLSLQFCTAVGLPPHPTAARSGTRSKAIVLRNSRKFNAYRIVERRPGALAIRNTGMCFCGCDIAWLRDTNRNRRIHRHVINSETTIDSCPIKLSDLSGGTDNFNERV